MPSTPTPDFASCIICKKGIGQLDYKLKCPGCCGFIHHKCAGLPDSFFGKSSSGSQFTSDQVAIFCANCFNDFAAMKYQLAAMQAQLAQVQKKLAKVQTDRDVDASVVADGVPHLGVVA